MLLVRELSRYSFVNRQKHHFAFPNMPRKFSFRRKTRIIYMCVCVNNARPDFEAWLWKHDQLNNKFFAMKFDLTNII